MSDDKVYQFSHESQHPLAAPMTLERFSRLGVPELREMGWRSYLAWRLRLWADRLDGRSSYAYSGMMPRVCTERDFWDAMTHGLMAVQRYLADIALDRSVHVPSTVMDDNLDNSRSPR